jgi:hypothetical protein
MNTEEFNSLKKGDILEHKKLGYLVTIDFCLENGRGEKYYLATRVIDVSNPDGWEKICMKIGK